MFEKVRKPVKAKNIVAYIIFGAICVVFVFLGIGPSQFGITTGGPAAIVNKEPISIADYREAYSRLQNQYQSQMSLLPAAQRQFYVNALRTQALEILINSEVVAQSAEAMGLHAADHEIRKYITNIPFFQKDGRFQRELYDNYLRYRKVSTEKFEAEVRKDLSRSRVQELLEVALTPPKVSLEMNTKSEQTQVNLSFAAIGPDQWEKNSQPTNAEVKAYVAEEKNRQKLEDFYQATKSKYTQAEQVRASHILIKFDEQQTGSESAALEKIKNIAKEIVGGASFADLAAKYSEDPGSKEKNGDLGFFPRGRMVPEFEQVAFGLPIGKVSEPVKTPFGFHLIKVEERKAAETRPLSEVVDLVARDLLKGEKIKVTQENLNQLLSAGEDKQVMSILKKLGGTWQETGMFQLSSSVIPKLGGESDLLTVALQAGEGQLAPQTQKSQGKDYVFKLLKVKEESSKVKKSELEGQLQSRAAADIFGAWAQAQKETARIERNQQILVN